MMMHEEEREEMLEREAAERERLQLLRQVRLQFDAEDFVRSDIGRYLATCSELAKADALHGLVTCIPSDAEQILKYQVDYRVATTWLDWIARAISEGVAAQQQLVDADG